MWNFTYVSDSFLFFECNNHLIILRWSKIQVKIINELRVPKFSKDYAPYYEIIRTLPNLLI